MTETEPAEAGNPPLNPYTLTLGIIGITAWVIGGLAFLLALGGNTVAATWATALLGFGTPATLLWLLACALTWKPPAK